MRIGVLAAQSGVSTKALRFYETAGLLPAPPRSPSGYRDYPPGATARLAFIRDAQAAGLTLAEIRAVLAIRDSGAPPCRHVTELIDQHLDQVEQRLAELTKTRAALRGLRDRAEATHPETCDPDRVCRILSAGLDH